MNEKILLMLNPKKGDYLNSIIVNFFCLILTIPIMFLRMIVHMFRK
jgi:hypothetical protein